MEMPYQRYQSSYFVSVQCAGRSGLRTMRGTLGLATLLPLAQAQARIQLTQSPNRDLVYGECTRCHDLRYLQNAKGMNKEQWQGVLNNMKRYGFRLTPEQNQKIPAYLSAYLGPSPAPAATISTDPLSGKTVFENQCSACHQPSGQGLSGAFPPLAGNKDIFLNTNYPVYVVLNGLRGPINVEGASYDGEMPSFGFLSNNQIAAVVQYARSAWGNRQERPKAIQMVTAQDVAEARQKPMSAQKVYQYRQEYRH